MLALGSGLGWWLWEAWRGGVGAVRVGVPVVIQAEQKGGLGAKISSTFQDGFHGAVAVDFSREGGDFVLRRADGLFAYQLACAIDDSVSDGAQPRTRS